MAKDNSLPITDELVASFLDGNTTAEQTLAVLEAARHDADLRMLLEISHRVDDDMVFSITGRHIYDRLSLTPEEALAASDITTHNLCAVQCEAYILEQYDESISCDTLAEQARSNNWITPEGMPIANIGKLLELQGFSVSRKYLASIKDVEKALTDGNRVIAVIDGGELVGDPEQEALEDVLVGEIPDHAVVVTALDPIRKLITIYDPQTIPVLDEYPLERFMDAWEDSRRYVVEIRPKTV